MRYLKQLFKRKQNERTKLTQKTIDGAGEHRRDHYAMLSQIRNAVFPSTQSVVE